MPLITFKDGRKIPSEHVLMFQTFEKTAEFLLSNGSTISGDPWSDIEESFFPIIPAAAGHSAIFSRLGSDGKMYYTKRAIVGWKICKTGSYPMFVGWVDDETGYDATIDPTGTVTDSDGNQWPDFEAWRIEYEAEILSVKAAA